MQLERLSFKINLSIYNREKTATISEEYEEDLLETFYVVNVVIYRKLIREPMYFNNETLGFKFRNKADSELLKHEDFISDAILRNTLL